MSEKAERTNGQQGQRADSWLLNIESCFAIEAAQGWQQLCTPALTTLVNTDKRPMNMTTALAQPMADTCTPGSSCITYSLHRIIRDPLSGKGSGYSLDSGPPTRTVLSSALRSCLNSFFPTTVRRVCKENMYLSEATNPALKLLMLYPRGITFKVLR